VHYCFCCLLQSYPFSIGDVICGGEFIEGSVWNLNCHFPFIFISFVMNYPQFCNIRYISVLIWIEETCLDSTSISQLSINTIYWFLTNYNFKSSVRKL
jgi:hypothetical protein